MNERQFASFYLSEALFGIDIVLVREINRAFALTPVDRAPAFVAGVMNLRGQIVTVLNLGKRLGIDTQSRNKDSTCIILKTSQELLDRGDAHHNDTVEDLVGLLVTRPGDVVTVASEKIETSPANIRRVDNRYLAGIAKLDTGLMAILNCREILKPQNAAIPE